MTEHAQTNLNRYSELIKGDAVKKLMFGISKVAKVKGSIAVVVNLDSAIKNPYRDDWKANDVLVAIIRNGTVVTTMLTRKSQCNKGHFRTDRIARVH